MIGSHTIKGWVVMDQLDIIEAEGYTAKRFISIHTQAEPDFELHQAVAARGAWIEYDNIGWVPDEEAIPLILRALESELGRQILLSHDMGWFDSAKPGGGEPKPYTHLVASVLPKLRAAGVDEATIVQLTHTNPFEAFARWRMVARPRGSRFGGLSGLAMRSGGARRAFDERRTCRRWM